MKHAWRGWGIIALGLCVPSIAVAGEELVTKEMKGFRFQVPADWPVEERAGKVGPVPVEEYLSKKFTAVTASMTELEKRVAAAEGRVAEMEKKASAAAALEPRVSTVEQRVVTMERAHNDQGRAVQELKGQLAAMGQRPSPAAPTDLVPQQVEEPVR